MDHDKCAALIQEAAKNLELRRDHEAVEFATEAIRLDPGRARAYLVRAMALRRLNQLDAALADLAMAIRLDPDRPPAYLVRAEIFKRLREYDRAIADADRAISLDPNNAAAHEIRAACREAGAAAATEVVWIEPSLPSTASRDRGSGSLFAGRSGLALIPLGAACLVAGFLFSRFQDREAPADAPRPAPQQAQARAEIVAEPVAEEPSPPPPQGSAAEPQPAEPPSAAVERLEPPAAASSPTPTFLVTLPRVGLRQSNGWWSENGQLVLGGLNGQPFARHPLTFEGRHSPRGVYLHASSAAEMFVAYRLDRKFDELQADVIVPSMLPEQGDPRTPLIARVQGDGRVLWESKPLARKGDHQPCRVSVTGINELSLRVKCPGADNWGLAAWVEPRLYALESGDARGLGDGFPRPILRLTFDEFREDDKRLISAGAGVRYVAGKVGKGVEFDGAAIMRVSGSCPGGARPRTLAAWLKSGRGPVGQNVHVVTYGPIEPTKAFGIMQAEGKWRFFDFGGGLGTVFTIDQLWHHHAVTYDGETIRYFFDGARVAEVSRSLETMGQPLILGSMAPGGKRGDGYVGLIDELMIWDVALSADQVKSVMRAEPSDGRAR